MKRVRATVVLAALLATLVLASSAGTSEGIVVTRDSLALPGECTPRTVADLVARFFDAFNRGDWDVVDSLVAPAGPTPPSFALFSLVRDAVVYEREQLISYLVAARAAPGRTRPSYSSSSVAVVYAVERGTGIAGGKGVIDCASNRIWQWAMGSPVSGPPPVPCPEPPAWSPSGPLLACTAGPNAKAVTEDFRPSMRSSRLLPRPCGPTVVSARVRSALSAFNTGLGDAFARHFAPRAVFHPYSETEPQIFGRGRIARFVNTSYDTGGGWTASALFVPTRGRIRDSRPVAFYGVDLLVTKPGRPQASGNAKVSFDCESALIRSWGGPNVPTPWPCYGRGDGARFSGRD